MQSRYLVKLCLGEAMPSTGQQYHDSPVDMMQSAKLERFLHPR